MKLETQTHSKHHEHLACPRCGQNAVVQHGSVYSCLNCNFRRNVSNNESNDAVGVLVLLSIFAFLVALMLEAGGAPIGPAPELQSGATERVG